MTLAVQRSWQTFPSLILSKRCASRHLKQSGFVQGSLWYALAALAHIHSYGIARAMPQAGRWALEVQASVRRCCTFRRQSSRSSS
eukprot:332897-Amphidinium_carterae.2